MAKLPVINQKHRICIVCEGYEDKAYISRLLELHVWSNSYDISLKNAKSASNIFAVFQDIFQNNIYELVLVFCDTDKAPYREYCLVKKKINDFFGKRKASDKLIIFANPCTMQIILSHFGEVSLKNQGKKTNASVIEQLTGVANYDAHEDQIQAICSKIFQRSYPDMRRRVAAINETDTVSPSTNMALFLDRFEKDDVKWITEINSFLAKEQLG